MVLGDPGRRVVFPQCWTSTLKMCESLLRRNGQILYVFWSLYSKIGLESSTEGEEHEVVSGCLPGELIDTNAHANRYVVRSLEALTWAIDWTN